MEDHEERMDTRLLPRLTKFNWMGQFRDAFKEYALTLGAGEIIITGNNLDLAPPDRLAMVVPQPQVGTLRIFAVDGREDRLFEN